MALSGIAIDVGWLIELDTKDYAEQLDAYNLVDRMRKSETRLLIDHEGKIIREYTRYMTAMSAGRKLLTELLSCCTSYVSGKPSAACAAALKANGFDPSDLPYIGVAQNGSGVYITHEEKHLEATRCAIADADCGVKILSTSDVSALLT